MLLCHYERAGIFSRRSSILGAGIDNIDGLPATLGCRTNFCSPIRNTCFTSIIGLPVINGVSCKNRPLPPVPVFGSAAEITSSSNRLHVVELRAPPQTSARGAKATACIPLRVRTALPPIHLARHHAEAVLAVSASAHPQLRSSQT